MKQLTILDAIDDVFAGWFKDRTTWQPWFAFLRALFALPMNESELALFSQCTGRKDPPTIPATEAWLVCGRRAGKSFMLALTATYLACFHDYRKHLAKGERGTIMVIAQDRAQARVIMRYIQGLLTVPMLARMVAREVASGFDLDNGITIEIHVASYRSTRGYTIVAALLDELAFWPTEGASDPDSEIIAAIRPGMATIPGAMLLCASSPYARRGALWESYRKHFGKAQNSILVWQAATRTMNPTVPQSVIDEAMHVDPARAGAEYMAEFRTDIESYINREVVEACIAADKHERPPLARLRYVGFVDPSGGSADSFTLGISHREGDNLYLDCVREVRPPFSPEAVVADFASTLKTYRVSKVAGDRYAGEWPREQFRKYGIQYEPSRLAKSDLYRDLLPLLNSHKVSLLDLPRLVTQLTSLERRTSRGGRDSIDHPLSAHDDLANCVAGALLLAHSAHRQSIRTGCYGYGGRITWDDPEPECRRVRSVRVTELLAPAARGP